MVMQEVTNYTPQKRQRNMKVLMHLREISKAAQAARDDYHQRKDRVFRVMVQIILNYNS